MSVTGNSNLLATKNDLIVSLVQRELRFAAKLLPTISDWSSFAVKGVKQIEVPKLTSFTVVNRATTVPGATAALTASVDVIPLDQRAYVSWLVDQNDEIESSINVQLEYLTRAAASHGRYVDTQILAVLAAAAGDDVGPGPITAAKILDAREFLMAADADMSAITMLIGPDQERTMLGLDAFSRADIYGSAIVPSGVIGRVFGMPILVHTGVPAGQAYFYERGGLGIAFQLQPNVAEQMEIEQGTTAKRVAMDQKFGVAALQKGEKGVGPTETPLIVKMET